MSLPANWKPDTFTDGQQQLANLIDERKSKLHDEMAGIVTSTSAMLEERALDFTGRLGAARISAAEALETDLGKLAEARKGIEIYLNEHSRKLAESGDRMTSLIEATKEIH